MTVEVLHTGPTAHPSLKSVCHCDDERTSRDSSRVTNSAKDAMLRQHRLAMLHWGVIALGVVVLAASSIVAWSSASATFTATVGPVPLLGLMCVAVPVTNWLCRNALTLAGLGGGVHVAFDSAVLAFLTWCGFALIDDPQAVDFVDASRWRLGALLFLIWWIGVAFSELGGAGRRQVIRLFNVSMSAIGGAGFVAVSIGFHSLSTTAEGVGLGPSDLAAIIVATAAYCGVDVIVTGASVAWEDDQSIAAAIGDTSALIVVGTVLAVNSTAILAATLLGIIPWAVSLLLPTVVLLTYSTRVGTSATSERRRSSAMYRGAAACQVAQSELEVVKAVVQAGEDAVAATVTIGDTPPSGGEVGSFIDDQSGVRWLVARPRAAGHSFVPEDERSLATLAALFGQSMSRIRSVERIQEMASTDELTGLMNRRSFTQTLRSRFAAGEPISVLFGDLDRFKIINDTHGHGVGDTVLQIAAQRIIQTIRPEDRAARLGGDEFAVLLPGADAEQAQIVRRRLLASIASPVDLDGLDVSVAMSLGAATITPTSFGEVDHDQNGLRRDRLVDELLDTADSDMYERKQRRAARRLALHAVAD